MTRRWIPALLLCAAAAGLAGCSTQRLVDGRVQSFSTLAAVPSPATYRIERLPSQQMPSFEPIAALADQALARAGLRRDDAAPRLLVQIGVQADTVPRYDPFGGPYGPYPWGFGGWYGRGWGVGGIWRMGEPTPLHRRAVSVVMRDAQTQAVVYETSAVHEDVWVSDPAVYGVLLDAALQGFPQPPQGPRQVRLPLPTATGNAPTTGASAPASTSTPAQPGVVVPAAPAR
ncbi:DUF4136 domain-containing protein [Acidovorax sp.]|jgi:hypothetical protein|uniref:DUF4136 domain-containing protein n=1 Tax=Acidovorax sp. TaxID=1872122 RepID=UPI0025C2D104|nr:DUF4136 domain-containing protein [Acidovorax sp.]MCI5070415.1 DUF4136 domain-containing protein [Acidovorax sp.]